MAAPINGTLPSTQIGPAAGPTTSSGAGRSGEAGTGSFGEALVRMVDSAEQSQTASNDAIAHMLNGTGDVHDAMIALQRAELTLQLTVQVRNKLVQAYQDIMRMPV